MTIQNAVSFVDKAFADEGLRAQVLQATAGKDPEQKAAAVADLGKSVGLAFTPMEAIQVRAVVRKKIKEAGHSDEELDDLDLQAVNGGVSGLGGDLPYLIGIVAGHTPGLPPLAGGIVGGGVTGAITGGEAGGFTGAMTGMSNGIQEAGEKTGNEIGNIAHTIFSGW